MFLFFGYGPGIFFILLGTFMILRGLGRPGDRRRLVRSGMGSILVGLGNLAMLRSWIVGLAAVGLGVWIIFSAARTRTQ
jgi:hypothetical protein